MWRKLILITNSDVYKSKSLRHDVKYRFVNREDVCNNVEPKSDVEYEFFSKMSTKMCTKKETEWGDVYREGKNTCKHLNNFVYRYDLYGKSSLYWMVRNDDDFCPSIFPMGFLGYISLCNPKRYPKIWYPVLAWEGVHRLFFVNHKNTNTHLSRPKNLESTRPQPQAQKIKDTLRKRTFPAHSLKK